MKQNSNKLLDREIAELIRSYPEIDELEVLAVDLSGHFFGKRYPLAKLESFARDGLAFPMSTIALSTLGEPLEGIYYGDGDGDPDAHFFLVPGSLSHLSLSIKELQSTLQHHQIIRILLLEQVGTLRQFGFSLP